MEIKSVLSDSFRIAWKDTVELFRNRLRFALIILMPIFMMAMIGFIYPSGNASTLNNVPVAIANQDPGSNNAALPSNIFMTAFMQINNQTSMLKLTNAKSASDIVTQIQNGEVDGGIIIPSNFSSCVLCREQATLIVITDQSNPTLSSELEMALTKVFDQMGLELAQENVRGMSPAITANESLAVVQPYVVKTEGVVSSNLSYFNFVAPGMIMMTVMSSVMTGLPGAISQEKEVGTLDGMMVAPISRFSVILGKASAQVGRGLFQGIIILAVAIGLFGVVINGSIWLVFALLLLGVFSFVGLGIAVTAIAKDQETAMMLMMTIMFPMMFLSGVFFPIQQMPWFMQSVSKFLPLTYAADALRRVMVLGAGASAISTDILVLVVFGAITLTIAVPLFKKMMSR